MYEMYRLQKGMVWRAEKGTEKYRFEEKNTLDGWEGEGNGTVVYVMWKGIVRKIDNGTPV
jgi:hypothetical protein